MKVFGYIRISTEDQCKGMGVESQENDIKEYCKLCGLNLDEIFRDIAISALADDRKGLKSMLDSLSADEPCLIIVQSVDRLWRSESIMADVKHKMMDANADVVSIMQPLYSIYEKTEVVDRYNSNVDYSAEKSREEINTKLTKAKRMKAWSGNKPCGAAPYGYKWQGNEIVIDYNNHLVVRDIFEKYIEFGSLAKVKDYCDGAGYKTSTGKEFSRQAIKNIIENDFYIGVVTYAGKKSQGHHVAIIDKTTYESAKAILKRQVT